MEQESICFVAFIVHSSQVIITGANAAYVCIQVNLGSILNTNKILTCSGCPAVGLQISYDVCFADTLVLQEAVAAFGICFIFSESADGMAAFTEQIIQYPVATFYQAPVY
jgi:hypothetical protein